MGSASEVRRGESGGADRVAAFDLKSGAMVPGHEACVSSGVAEQTLGVTFADFPALKILDRLKWAEGNAADARKMFDSVVDELGITLCSVATSRGIDKTGFRVRAQGLAIGGCEVSHAEAKRLRDFLVRMYGPWESGPEMHAAHRDELVERMGTRMVRAINAMGSCAVPLNNVCEVHVGVHVKAIVEDVLDHVGVRIIASEKMPLVRLGPGGDFTREIPARG